MLSVSIPPLSSIGVSFGPAPRIEPVATTISGSPGTVSGAGPGVYHSQSTSAAATLKSGSATTEVAGTGAAASTVSSSSVGSSSGGSSSGVSSSGGSSSGGSSKSSSAASSASPAVSAALAEQELMDSFSTTVRGKQYSGNVVESAGEYTASVATVAGASATASLVQAAETNLVTRIDELV